MTTTAEKKEVKMVPKLRFQEFFDVWKSVLFSDLYSFHPTNSFSRDKLNYEGGHVRNIHYGDIHTKYQTNFILKNEDVPFINEDVDLTRIKEESYCKNGDIVMVDASEDYSDIGKSIELIDINNKKVLAGLHTFLARPITSQTTIGFISILLKSWKLRKQIMTIAQGTKVLSLSTSRVSKLKLLIPSLPEQKKIADFLSAIDKNIEQLTRKKELLLQYKKGVMQKLFAQEIRFKPDQTEASGDDNGEDFPDWEEKKLGELASFSKGKGISKNDIRKGGSLPCIRYGELYTTYSETINSIISSTNVDNNELVLSQEGDVIIPSSGETNIDIAKASCVMAEGIALGGDLNILRGNFKGVFLSYLLNNKYRFDIAKLAQGNSVVHLYSSQLKDLKISIPSINEQQKIASFLSAIDEKLNGVTEALEATQTFKKGLLQQMFV